MISKPSLKQVRPSSPFRPLFDALNHAVRDQATVRPGPGLGLSHNGIRLANQGWMIALTTADGVPAAEYDEASHALTPGKGEAIEYTVEVDDDGIVRFVLARPDDFGSDEDFVPTSMTIYNPDGTEIAAEEVVFLEKRFGLWVVARNEGPQVARAVCTAAIPAGAFGAPSSSGRAQIYRKAGGGWGASGDPVVVFNQFSTGSAAVGAALLLDRIDGDWFLQAADCP